MVLWLKKNTIDIPWVQLETMDGPVPPSLPRVLALGRDVTESTKQGMEGQTGMKREGAMEENKHIIHG